MAKEAPKKRKKLILQGKPEKEFEEFLSHLGENIRARRRALSITQEDFDEAPLPIDERNFRRIEAGGSNVTAKTLFAI